MNRSPHREPTSNNDLRRYANLFFRNWYFFLLGLIISIGAAKFINVLAPRKYMVSCEIAMGESEYPTVSSSDLVETIDFNEINSIRKEVGILKSKNLAEQTISTLDFNITYYELIKGRFIKRRRYNEMPFLIKTDSSDRIVTGESIYLKVLEGHNVLVYPDGDEEHSKIVPLGSKFTSGTLSFNIDIKGSVASSLDDYRGKEYLFHFNNTNEIVNTFWQSLDIQPSPMSQNILILSVTSENVNQAIAYLTKLCELYDQNDLQLRNRMASNTISFIDGQLSLLNQQLSMAEDSLIRFKRIHRIFQTEINTIVSEEFVRIDDELRSKNLQMQAISEIRLKLDSILMGGNIILPYLLSTDDSRLESGIENINRLVIEREVNLQNQKPGSPGIVKISQQIEAEVKAFHSYLEQEKEIMGKQIAKLKKELTKVEGDLLNLPTIERQLAKLTRNFQLTENLYNLYQQKRIEAKLAEASTVSNVRMLDPPDRESAIMVKPKKKQNIQIAVLLGLFIPAIFLIFYELIISRVREISDITNEINLPQLGKIVHSKANMYLPTVEFPWAAITESFRSLHARLNYLLLDPKDNVIAITSGASGEGKTFCAINLATVIAASGKKVLLIGLDLRRPKIHEVFEINNETGLTTYLIGNTLKKDLIHETFLKNLYLLNSGPIPPNPVELIEHKRMADLLAECRKEYDYIVIDSPPIGLVADALLISKLVDLYLFVIRMDQTRKTISSLLKELMESNSLKSFSLIFNDIKQPERYGYGYRYYNSYYQKEEVTPLQRRIMKLKRSKQ